MEPLHRDGPRRLGPFHLIGRLEPGLAELPDATRTYVARKPADDRTYVVTVPGEQLSADAAYGARLRAEAAQAQRLSELRPWLDVVAEVADETEPLAWRSSPYTPALPLAAALEVHGGPLPERTVRGLGAALAETLVNLHEQGFAHAGVSPRTVQLVGNGILLSGFGTARAAAPDGADRTGCPGLLAAATAPEQRTGGRPRPLGDVYAAGVVLAYAATAKLNPDECEVPPEWRDIVTACTAPDPVCRPDSTALLDALTRSAQLTAHAPEGELPTTVEGRASRAEPLLASGWLPRRVSAALATQAAVVLAAEAPDMHAPVPDPVARQSPEPTAPHESPSSPASAKAWAEAEVSPASDASPARPLAADAPSGRHPSRRHMLVGVVSGAAGLTVGAATAWSLTAEDPAPVPTAAQRLAAESSTRMRAKGAPPRVRWRYGAPGRGPVLGPAVRHGDIAVVVNRTGAFGIDLRSGKERWRQRDVAPVGPAQIVGDGLLLIPGSDLAVLDARDGHLATRAEKYRPGGGAPYGRLLAAADGLIWFTIGDRGDRGGQAASASGNRFVVAYDVSGERELWRSPAPGAFTGGQLLKNVFVATAASGRGRRAKTALVAFHRGSGKERWSRAYEGVGHPRVTEVSGLTMLLATAGAELRGYDLGNASVKPRWTAEPNGESADESRVFGPPVVHDGALYATDSSYVVHRIDPVDGAVRLTADPGSWVEPATGSHLPETVISPSGRLVVSVNESEMNAFDTGSGSPLWRFTDLPPERRGGLPRRTLAIFDEAAVVTNGGQVYALRLD